MSEKKAEIRMNFDIDEFAEIYKRFYKDTKNFVIRCYKPDQKQFKDMVRACTVGFAIMGGVGFLVRLVCIPLNKFLVG